MSGAVMFALLSPVFEGRVYPQVAPANTKMPYATYAVVTATAAQASDGETGLKRSTVQVTVWGSSYADAQAAADKAHRAVARKQGLIGPHRVRSITPQMRLDQFDEETKTHGVVQDFRVVWA